MKSKILILLGVFALSTTCLASSVEPMKTPDYDKLLNSIKSLDFPASEYVREVTEKTQVCLHHTASGKGVNGDYRQFLKPGRIATPIIVGHDSIYQLFGSIYWGYHLGVPESLFAKHNLKYQRLDKISIGVEIDNWGPLKLINNEFRAWPNKFGTGDKLDKKGNKLKVVVPSSEVVEYSKEFRGYKYYQRYTDYQIDTTATLLSYWNDRYAIPLTYNECMWDVSKKALSGEPGIYTHVSYRPDKSDCHPQAELIEMLKSLA